MKELAAKWQLGATVAKSSPGEYLQSFTSCTTHDDAKGTWRVWYSRYSQDETFLRFGYLDLADDFRTLRDTPLRMAERPAADGLNILGVPPHWNLVQPVHLTLPDGRERLYFWAHCPAEGIQRFLVADSDDGVNFAVEDWHRPALYHPNDRAISREALMARGLSLYCHNGHRLPAPDEPEATPEMLMNDATNVYLLPDGTFELYSAEVIPLPPDAPEPRQKDPLVRQIQRRTSQDGIRWSAPQHIIVRDANDPYDLQFYYLAVTHTPQGRLGILGHYRSDPGTMDMEFCRSQDGIHWQRERTPGFPRPKGVEMVEAPHALVRVGNLYYNFYSGYSQNHHGAVSPNASPDMPPSWIGVATIPADAMEMKSALII